MEKPQEMRALICAGTKDGKVEVRQVHRPRPGPTDVLVEVSAIALNPTDWKSARAAQDGFISGCDFCGVVRELGDDAKGHGIDVGARVAGMHFGSTSKERGAFAEYTIHDWRQVWLVPEGVSDEEAAAFGGIAIDTAAQALYIGESSQKNRHALPFPTEGKAQGTILIWSGASSVGSYAIQLAKLSGLTVVTTASPRNHAALKELGADFVYDYNERGVEEAIKRDHPVDYALDCFAEGDSTKRATQTFGPKGGKVVPLLPVKREGEGWRDDVSSDWTLVYTDLGKEFTFLGMPFPASAKDAEGAAHWHQVLPKLLAAGQLKPNRIRRCPGLLEKVREGMDYMKSRSHSHEKLVYRVTDEFNPVPESLAA